MTATAETTTGSTTDAGSTIAISAEDRAARLSSAGQAWNDRIVASVKNAQLVFSAKGSAQGSVSSVITAGKHTFT
ncbi:MAG: OsmC family protein, partial [Brevibacterium aurantiacum]